MSYKRHLRDLRRDLVHAAGCTEPGCATRLDLREKVEDARRRGVRIPRSFRHFERIPFDVEEWVVYGDTVGSNCFNLIWV